MTQPDPSKRGFTLVELLFIIAIIAIVAAIAIPRLLEGRKASNETSAVATLRSLYVAQQTFFERDYDGNGRQDYASSFVPLVGLVEREMASGASVDRFGYHFEILPSADFTFTWSATSIPQLPGKTGDRRFYIDNTGVLRYTTTGNPGPGDPAVGN